MVNEATLIIETELPIPFTVAEGTGIAKGTSLKLADLMTASASTAANDMVAGIAGSEKIASDGMVRMDVYRRGIFKVYLSGSCTAGDPAGTSASVVNYYYSLINYLALSGSKIAGTFLEDGTTGQTVLMELNPQQAIG